LLTTGQGLLGNNMFAYCRNSPANRVDTAGSRDETIQNNGGRFVGVGVQFEFSTGAYECGIEMIVYFDPEVCGGMNPIMSVYIYEGAGVDLLSLYNSTDFVNTINQLSTTIMTNTCEEPYGKADLIALQAAIFRDAGVSASILAIYGYDNFKTPDDYSGAFTTFSGSAKHVKLSYSYSSTCWSMSLGATTESKLSFGFGQTNYQLLKSYRLLERNAAA
jgi:hypothetical protein